MAIQTPLRPSRRWTGSSSRLSTALMLVGLGLSSPGLAEPSNESAPQQQEAQPGNEAAPPITPEQPEAWKASEWPIISLALQDKNSTEDLSQVGVLNNAWAMSEYAVGSVVDPRLSHEQRIAAHEVNLQRFITMPESEIRAALDRYLTIFPQLSRKTTRTIIIDIETPTQPRYFYKLLGGENHDTITPEFTGIVRAFARRYAIVRDAFPNAKLSVFSMGSPGLTSEPTPTNQASLRGEILATKMGMLQDVDAISPELYERYGPNDPLYQSRQRRTRQAMERALKIVEASDQPLDIIVLLTLTVFNAEGHSTIAGKPADLNGLADRLDYLASLGVRRVVFWNGDQNLLNSKTTVGQRFAQLRAVQQTRAEAAEDSSAKPEEPSESEAAPSGS